MEPIVALSTCLLVAALSALGGWLLGEIRGAARMRQFMEADDPHWLKSNSYAFTPTPSTSVRQRQRVRGMDVPPAQEADTQGHYSRLPAPRPSSHRRATFDNMPSLADLSEQSSRIRRDSRIWDDPETCRKLREFDPVAARLMRHYQNSIDMLIEVQECSAAPVGLFEIRSSARELEESDPPRISQVAPLSPHIRAAELAEERRALKAQLVAERAASQAGWQR